MISSIQPVIAADGKLFIMRDFSFIDLLITTKKVTKQRLTLIPR